MDYEERETALLQAFGQRIQKLRTERTGLNQEKFALTCGLSRAYIASIERGGRNISLLNLCRISEALAVAPSELLKIKVPRLLENTLPELFNKLTSRPAARKNTKSSTVAAKRPLGKS